MRLRCLLSWPHYFVEYPIYWRLRTLAAISLSLWTPSHNRKMCNASWKVNSYVASCYWPLKANDTQQRTFLSVCVVETTGGCLIGGSFLTLHGCPNFQWARRKSDQLDDPRVIWDGKLEDALLGACDIVSLCASIDVALKTGWLVKLRVCCVCVRRNNKYWRWLPRAALHVAFSVCYPFGFVFLFLGVGLLGNTPCKWLGERVKWVEVCATRNSPLMLGITIAGIKVVPLTSIFVCWLQYWSVG